MNLKPSTILRKDNRAPPALGGGATNTWYPGSGWMGQGENNKSCILIKCYIIAAMRDLISTKSDQEFVLRDAKVGL